MSEPCTRLPVAIPTSCTVCDDSSAAEPGGPRDWCLRVSNDIEDPDAAPPVWCEFRAPDQGTACCEEHSAGYDEWYLGLVEMERDAAKARGPAKEAESTPITATIIRGKRE